MNTIVGDRSAHRASCEREQSRSAKIAGAGAGAAGGDDRPRGDDKAEAVWLKTYKVFGEHSQATLCEKLPVVVDEDGVEYGHIGGILRRVNTR